MKKWALMILSLLMMLALAAPAMAQTGEPDAAQNAGTVSAPYTVEFTYDGNQYVMPGDSSVRLSAVLDEIGLTGEAEAVAVSDESLFSASNETGEWIVTAHQAFDTTEWMKVTINGVVYEITVTDDSVNTVTYFDASGAQQSCTNYMTVESNSTDWNNAWYVVSSNTTISDRITVSGTVNLILTNNATLTASKGITVGSDATLNIYAQTDDEATMGALVASGANDNQQYNAGIGGVDNTAAGTITINGGKINATGMVGAGIGSGGQSGATVGTITINGGIVTAQDGSGYGTGIGGGGIQGKASTINLNGGVIHAAGIGSGYMGGDCSMTVNISDGVRKIVATPVQGGACIGKGASASGTVTVNFISGRNIVTGADKDAVFYDTGEGSERQIRAKALNHAVTMSDDLKANITLNTEYAFASETVTLTLGTAVDATTLSVNDGAVATTDAGNRQYTFTMPDEDVTVTATLLQTYAVSLPTNMEVVSATNAADADGKYITGTTVTFMASFPYAASNVSDGTSTLTADDGVYSVTVADADIIVSAIVERSSTIDLTDASGDFAAINNDVLTGTTSHTITIANGANITLNNTTINGGIVCEGSATITLIGTNSVSNTSYSNAGIQIGGSGTTLTIKGNGSLTAAGGSQAAGIGLGRTWYDDATGGSIVIEGGAVTASGGNGIGTGTVGNSKTATVGDIVIKGGTVNARLGKGTINYGCTATIGAIKIYDTIDKVDASAITEGVTYMHDETDVTASASTYFTIIEDGDRRVITPKDDTDYTITIADDIEHGSIACAAETAKYGDKVTITATPDFGYRLSRLVVKDAENNDVASTGNTFLMPKDNVMVSAVFEQGTHGTTEFKLMYSTGPSPEDQVYETIYDGVTTVNLQQGQSYQILKYDDEYSYREFLLDNDTYDATIPYSGGTGTFPEYGNGTNFSVDYNGESGFYDITMTDVGNGKWSVSIQKTVGKMDDIPDQTYTGNAITPEPLVLAGSLNLTKGTDYEYSYTNNTNVGTAKVTVTFKGDYASLGSVEKEFHICKTVSDPTIAPVEPTITGADLVLNGSLDFRFYVALPENFDASGAHMVFTIHGRTVDVPYTEAKDSTDAATPGQKIFSCPVYSIEMAEDIEAVFHYSKDGAAKTATLTSSVKKYLDALDALDGNPEKLTKLTAAVRDYGHYIQPYLSRLHKFTIGEGGYAEMPAATASIMPVTADALEEYQTKWKSHDNTVLDSVSYYDTFSTSTILNVQVKLKSAKSNVTATVDGNACAVTNLGGNLYGVQIPGIAANNLDKKYNVVFSESGTTICDIDVSALTYVRAVLASRNEKDEAAALTAFYNYFKAAEAYGNP